MKKLLALIAFSVLLLVPVGAQQVFADHPADVPTCPSPGFLIFDPGLRIKSFGFGTPFCQHSPFTLIPLPCSSPYIQQEVFDTVIDLVLYEACVAPPNELIPATTLAAQCQGAAVLLSNHCFAEIIAMVGGVLLSIDKTAVLVAAIGTDPVVTGLVALTMAGLAGQAAWFIHRRKRKIKICDDCQRMKCIKDCTCNCHLPKMNF